jgi:hypothetical protein
LKLQGFIGAAYKLDAVNVDAQKCVNLIPEVIESGLGKEAQVAYLKSAPGLETLLNVGTGPIRLVHQDSIGRTFVASGNKIYRVSRREEWTTLIKVVSYEVSAVTQASGIDTTTEVLTTTENHGYYTGLKVWVESSGTLPTGLSASLDYYVISVSANTLKLAQTLSDALNDIPVNITAIGTGTLSVLPYGGDLDKFQVGVKVDGGIDYTANSFESLAHGFYTALQVKVSGDGKIPVGLLENTNYYISTIGLDAFVLSTSILNAISGTAIDITSPAGTWVERELGTDGDKGGASVSLTTTSGAVKAASMSLFGDGRDSSTIFVDGEQNYLFTDGAVNITEDIGLTTNFGLLSSFALGEVLGSTDIVWTDGFFILNEGGTNRFWVSDLQNFNLDSLSFASSEGSPDKVLALEILNRYLYIFNEKTTEVYANTGNADFPFERIGGGFLEVGTLAANSVKKVGPSICFLGRSEEGQGMVFKIDGLSPQRISTHAIEQAISTYANPQNASAWGYQRDGHTYYVLNFDEATWVYDLSTGLWHERAYNNANVLERHRVQHHAFDSIRGLHICGDYESNKVYLLKEGHFLDDTSPMVRLRRTPHYSSENKRLFCSRLFVDMKVAVGLSGTGVGSNPQAYLSWSDDGGYTWKGNLAAAMGRLGELSKRVIWRRLGSSRDRIFEVKVSDPVDVVLIDAQIEFEQGAH